MGKSDSAWVNQTERRFYQIEAGYKQRGRRYNQIEGRCHQIEKWRVAYVYTWGGVDVADVNASITIFPPALPPEVLLSWTDREYALPASERSLLMLPCGAEKQWEKGRTG